MTEKVKVTQEQADALKDYLADCKGDISEAIDEHSDVYCDPDNGWIGDHKALNKIAPSDLARALLIGYEVEETFEVGDWVAFNSFSKGLLICKVENATAMGIDTDYVASNGCKQIFAKSQIRHATPEEIKVEQERRLWKSINREVGEFKKGDIGLTESGSSSRSPENITAWYESGHLKGFYPAESFIEFGGADE